jgi:hypothetical protein
MPDVGAQQEPLCTSWFHPTNGVRAVEIAYATD